ncbi:hypothetical protein [Leucobacter sp. PH1c]|uniref:sunset domain-containing protein n=1 Tax=Leucobacter sp. PH1c TaxID=1397278 RepID=UPI0004680BD5|nr:hypothetical protein [Leucobacter sp. PH1c]
MRKLLGVLLTAGLVLGLSASPALAEEGTGDAWIPAGIAGDVGTGALDPAEPGFGETAEPADPGAPTEPGAPTAPAPGESDPGDPEPREPGPGEPGDPVDPIPAPEQLPAVTGTAQVGQTVQGTPGLWLAPDLEFALQWQLDGADVPGATGERFLLPGEASGKTLRLAVTASRAGAEPVTAYSAGLRVSPGTLQPGALSLTGTASVGQQLSVAARASVPSGARVQIQWKRNGAAIAGATGVNYTLTAKDLGATISATVTSSLPGYTTAALTARAAKPVAAGALTAPAPKISGSAVVGTTLTSSVSGWKPGGVALKYQWKRNGAAIAKATGSRYTLTSADAGKKITLSVTGALTGYTSRTVTSTATATVLRPLTAAPTPTISGTSKVGAKLTAAPGAWKPAPVALSYQWLRNGAAISGATKSSYTLTKADGGAKISVRVTGKKSGYVTTAKTSGTRSIPKVLGAAKPKISGSALAGSKLTVNRGTWTSGTKLSTQWLRNGAVIRGATGTSYTLGGADIGKRITVRVVGTKSGYSTATQTSAATAAVKAPARYNPGGSWNCPAWAPIKGNQNGKEWIYHVPGGAYYSRTKPEACFSSASAAVAAGYRASKR